jgi:A/G-specific adenine glycosylase
MGRKSRDGSLNKGPNSLRDCESGSEGLVQDQDRDPSWVGSVRQHLIAWYEESQRDFPWRRGNDPYRILVSEMMLVQTTAAAVIPYFERFLRRFPDVQTLASADEVDVLKSWEGLGYYRRARQLQAAARTIVDRHAGEMPRELEAVRALPGVGRYVSGAILSFAFDLPAPIVEANSQRVLARLLAWRGELKTAASQTRLWATAERLVPPRGAGKFNQALMDLGALVCTPRSPACLLCPLTMLCAARRLGIQDSLPIATPRPSPQAVTEACALVVREGSVLVVQRNDQGLWSGFWEFPTINLEGADPAGRSFGAVVSLSEGVERLTGIRVRTGPEIKRLTYAVTRHRVVLRVHVAHACSGSLKPGPGLVDVRWVATSELAELPLGSAARRLAAWIPQHFEELVGR